MRSINFVLMFVVLLFASCEQYYVPEIDTQNSCLVFEGFITDVSGSHVIKISKSQSLNQDSVFEKASGFTVFIEDDKGTMLDTREKYPGMYYTRAFQQGVVGNKYRMVATSPQGKIYYSTWELLTKVAPIDTVYGVFAEENILLYNETAGYYEETLRGVQIVTSSKTLGYSPYNRYEYDLVFQTLQMYPTTPFSTLYYIARPAFSERYDFVSVANGNLYSNNNIVDHAVDFVDDRKMNVQIVIPEEEFDESGKPIYEEGDIDFYQVGFLARINQYSLSEKGYKFWDAIYKQRNASGQIFDPVESQIIGNIYCLQDTTELVYGFLPDFWTY
jgi:hypothetical protein